MIAEQSRGLFKLTGSIEHHKCTRAKASFFHGKRCAVSKELQLIVGVVADLVIQRGEEVFVQSSAERAASGGVAAVLASAGMAGAATGALLASTGAADSVEFFTCIVNGNRVAGRFSKATFKVGDAVEVVADAQSDGTYAAVAIRRPSDQTVWMFPHCSRGAKAHRAFAARMFCWIFLGLNVLFIAFFGTLEWRTNDATSLDFLLFCATIFAAISLIASLYYSIGFTRRWRPFVVKAEAIFTALGYTEPSRVDMEQQHKKYLKQNGGTWPYLHDGPWVYRYADAC